MECNTSTNPNTIRKISREPGTTSITGSIGDASYTKCRDGWIYFIEVFSNNSRTSVSTPLWSGIKCISNNWMGFHETVHRCLWWPEDESYGLLWSPDLQRHHEVTGFRVKCLNSYWIWWIPPQDNKFVDGIFGDVSFLRHHQITTLNVSKSLVYDQN